MAINISGKKPKRANKRSHALNKTPRKQKLNLQVVRLENGKRVRITAKQKKSALKTQKAA